MKRKTLIAILFFILCFTSCNSGTGKVLASEEKKDSIALQGRVSFKYDNFKKGIILDVIVDDTLHLKALFDTGAYGVAMSGKLLKKENKFQNKTVEKIEVPLKLKIGNWTYSHPTTEYINNELLFNFHECSLIFGRIFFTNKVIEISFEHYYIRELQTVEKLDGYDKVPLRLLYGWLPTVKAKVCIDGKVIESEFILDTGYNGTIKISSSLVKKYNLSTKANLEFESVGIVKNYKNVRSEVDTIQVGHNHITNTIAFFDTETSHYPYPVNGVIGNKFFDNFSVVLDFKNNYLYLKPIDK